jgi:hypothetical protein
VKDIGVRDEAVYPFGAWADGHHWHLFRGVLILRRDSGGDLLAFVLLQRFGQRFALDAQVVAVIRGSQQQRVLLPAGRNLAHDVVHLHNAAERSSRA